MGFNEPADKMMFRFRGKLMLYVYAGIIAGVLFSLNSYFFKANNSGKRKASAYRKVFEDMKRIPEAADRKLVKEREPLKVDKKNQALNRELILNKLPRVGHVPDINTEAERLFHKVRVVCWIPTTPYMFFKRSIYVLQTWGKRCNKLFFFVSKSKKDPTNWHSMLEKDTGGKITDLDHSHYAQENLEFVELDTTETGSWDLTKKVFTSWNHLHDHHLDDGDWFLKVDDDTFVIMENLRYFLSKQDPTKPVYYGHKFLVNKQEYHSGGAGYVMSRQTLQLFSTHQADNCTIKSGVEDMQMGQCMKILGVEVGDSVDEKNRAYFYPLGPSATLTGKYPKWFNQYDKITSQNEGIIGFPRMPISFHYVGQQKMLELELFIYYIQVHGGVLGNDDEESFAGGIVKRDLEPEEPDEEMHNEPIKKHIIRHTGEKTTLPWDEATKAAPVADDKYQMNQKLAADYELNYDDDDDDKEEKKYIKELNELRALLDQKRKAKKAKRAKPDLSHLDLAQKMKGVI